MNVIELTRSDRKFTPKPWGWEEEIYAEEDPDVDLCVKTIFLKAGHPTDVRAHNVDMVVACASGEFALEWFVEKPTHSLAYAVHMRSSILRPNAAVLVEADTFHRLVAIEDTYLNVTSSFIDKKYTETLPDAPWSSQATVMPSP